VGISRRVLQHSAYVHRQRLAFMSTIIWAARWGTYRIFCASVDIGLGVAEGNTRLGGHSGPSGETRGAESADAEIVPVR
jgi:hypothetical protein